MFAADEMGGFRREFMPWGGRNELERRPRSVVIVQKPEVTSEGNSLGPAADAQYAVDLAVVPLDCVDGHHQAFGYLAVRQSVRQQAQNLNRTLTQGFMGDLPVSGGHRLNLV